MALKLAYITTSDKAEAERIGLALIERRLAACVNILDGMTSLYRWEGKIERGQEAVLIAKTDDARFAALQQAVQELHSYSVPCVLGLAVAGGNPDYLSWLAGELRP